MRCTSSSAAAPPLLVAVLLLALLLLGTLQQAAAGACDDQCKDDQGCSFPYECRAVTRLGCTIQSCMQAPCAAQGDCAPGEVCSPARVCKLQQCAKPFPALWPGAATVPGKKDGSCPEESHCDALSGVCLPGTLAEAAVFTPDPAITLSSDTISMPVSAQQLLSNDKGSDLYVTRIVRASRFVSAKVNEGTQQIIVSRSAAGYTIPSGAQHFVYYVISTPQGAETVGRLDIKMQSRPKPSAICQSGTHWCGSSCASDNSVASCGLLCSSPCPEPENGKAVCLSGLCDIACNDNFIKEPSADGSGYVCERITPVGTLSMPGDYSVWVGGFNVITGWNGASWDTRYPDAFVTGIAVADTDYAVAVGGPVFYIFNAGMWTAYASPTALYGAAASPDQLWMVGERGTVWIVTDDFTQYANQVPGVAGTLIGVTATGAGSAVAVGEQGTIVRLSGKEPSGWKKVYSGTSETLNAVVAGGGAVWAVGNKGTILTSKADGSWVAHKSGTTQNLFDVTVVSDKLAWAVGDEGGIFKYDGASWSTAATSDGVPLYAIHAWDATFAMAFGYNSIVMSWNGQQWTKSVDLGVGVYLAVGVLPATGATSSRGRKLKQSSFPQPPGTQSLVPATSTCATNGVRSVTVTDTTYTGKDKIARLSVPVCPGSGPNVLRCQPDAAGKMVCSQNSEYMPCSWQTSGGQVTSSTGVCPNSGPYCGTIAGTRRSFQAIQGITPGTAGVPYRLDAAGKNVPLDSAAMFAPCVVEGQSRWPATSEDPLEKAKRVLLESKAILIGDITIPKSTNLSTWTSSTNPCPTDPTAGAWEGVKCDEGKTMVVGIKIVPDPFKNETNTKLQGQLPNGLAELDTLQSIDLSNNNMTGTLPTSWSKLTDTASINLANNAFNGTLPETWATMPKLWQINMANNSLSGTLPEAWSTFPCLKDPTCRPTKEAQNLELLSQGIIDLTNNVIGGTIPSSLGGLLNLQQLNLATNGLTGTLPPSFSNLRNLQSLSLFGNFLFGTLPSEWSTIGANLMALPAVVGLIPYAPFDMRKIRLSQNMLSGTIPASWSDINPRFPLQLSFYDNDGLTGCLPYAWFNRQASANPFGGNPYYLTQLISKETPKDSETQAAIVSCFTAFTPCDKTTKLEKGKGGLAGTGLTGWCAPP